MSVFGDRPSCRMAKLHNPGGGVGGIYIQNIMRVVPPSVDKAKGPTFISLFRHVYLQAHTI